MPPPAPLNGELSPRALLQTPMPEEARLGTALGLATSGEFERAEAAAAALASSASGEKKERAERERARLAALAKLRQELLARCVADKLKLKVDRDGKTIGGVVVEATGEQFTLSDARGKPQSFPLTTIKAEELLRRLSELKLELGSAAIRSYAALLAGRKTWAKGIEKASDPESESLRADAGGLPALIATGEAARAIEELGARPLPADGASADSMVASIRAVIASYGKEPLVVERKPLLRELASFALTKGSEARGLRGAGLKGVVSELANGSVRIAYDFVSADELQDFEVVDTPHFSWSKLTPLGMPEDRWGHQVVGGELEMSGRGCLRHRLPLDAPVRLEVTCSYGRRESGLTTLSTLRPAICDDGKGSLVTNLDLLWVEVIDKATTTRTRSKPNPDPKVATDRPLQYVLSHDGKAAHLECEGHADLFVQAPMRTRGNVALYWMADTTNRVDQVVIEGKLAPGAVADLCRRANEGELAKIFGE